MAVSERKKASNKKWDVANIERLSIAVPKGQRDKIKAAAAASGESVNAYIIGAINARMSGTPAPAPSPAPAEHPAAEQPTPKAEQPEQPQPPTSEDLIEQQKAKLAEQVEEMKRREAEKAEEAARQEAEQKKQKAEIREALRMYAEQFNREQARLAGEGKAFKEWSDLYTCDQNDVLHAASFRKYREVYSLQELTPRERKARGFPLFDEESKKT